MAYNYPNKDKSCPHCRESLCSTLTQYLKLSYVLIDANAFQLSDREMPHFPTVILELDKKVCIFKTLLLNLFEIQFCELRDLKVRRIEIQTTNEKISNNHENCSLFGRSLNT